VVLKGLSQCRTQPDSSIYYYCNDDDAMQRAMLRMDYCVREMAQWMSDNKLKLNDNNSKVIVFNPSNTETPEHFRTFSICGTDIATKTSVEDLGVYFERNLSIEQQVKAICASCYFHLANIGAIRNSLTKGATEKLIHAFVSPKLDFCNSLHAALPACYICNLQRIHTTPHAF
jgi:hypothetical protein